MADRGNLGGVRRLPVRPREPGRPLQSQRQRAALQGRGARPEPRGSRATALPPPGKEVALRSVAPPPLTVGAPWLTWRYRLRGKLTASMSPGKAEVVGRRLPWEGKAWFFLIHNVNPTTR
jgi:hypothetical protein